MELEETADDQKMGQQFRRFSARNCVVACDLILDFRSETQMVKKADSLNLLVGGVRSSSQEAHQHSDIRLCIDLAQQLRARRFFWA